MEPVLALQWAVGVHLVGRSPWGAAFDQRPEQFLSSTDSSVTVSRHTRNGGRATRVVVDIAPVHHTEGSADQLLR